MKITYKEAKQRAPKRRDTWVRVLLLNWWVTPSTYLVARYTKITPESLTLCTWFMGSLAALAFGTGNPLLGVALYFIHFVLDGMDGKLSRILGKDDTFRGMMDFMLDGVVCILVVWGIATAFYDTFLTYTLLVWVGILFLDMRFSSMIYNLRASKGISDKYLISGDTEVVYGGSKVIRIYTKIQNKLDKFGLNILPTAGEAVFLMFIVGPIIFLITGDITWEYIMVALGVVCILPATLGDAILAIKLGGSK